MKPLRVILAFAVLLILVVLARGQNAGPAPYFEGVYFTNTGALCSLCKICTFSSGTTSPLSSYTSATGGTANTNPVITDAYGRASIWVLRQAYKLELRLPGTDGAGTCPAGTGAGTILKTVDAVPGIPAVGTAGYVAKFEGPNYLISSLITDNGTKIGMPLLNLTPLAAPGAPASGNYVYTDTADGVLKSSYTSGAVRRLGHQDGYATADFTTSSGTATAVTGMTVSVEAGVTYAMSMTVFVTSQTGGVSCIPNGGTATMTDYRAVSEIRPTPGTTVISSGQSTSIASAMTQSSPGNFMIHVEGALTANAAGTFALKCGLLTADSSTLTIKRGSFVEVR